MIEDSWGIRRHLRSTVAPFALLLSLAAWLGGCADQDATTASDALSDAGSDGNAGSVMDNPGRIRPGNDGDDEEGGYATTADGGANDDSRGPPALVSIKQGCDMRADRHCLRLQECSEFFMRLVFGKADTCRTRLAAECMAQANAPDVSVTQYSLVRCAQEISGQTCAEIIDRREPEACNPMGLRREGKGCASHLQCDSGYCEPSNDACGRCKAKRGSGESCQDDAACLAGLHCNQKGKCVRQGGLGEACGGENQECGTLLACLGGKCAPPIVAGGMCSTTDQCARAAGQVCVATTASVGNTLALPIAQCRSSVLGAPGTVCREGDNLTSYCAGGQDNCIKENDGVFRCVAPAMDGQACGKNANGRACVMPAMCVAGTCKLGPVTSCLP